MRELDALLGPDRSRIVKVFPDGWSIREPAVAADVMREGALMRNCLRPGSRYRSIAPDSPRFSEVTFWSLRDTENYPHAIFWADEAGDVWVWGSCDNPRPKAEYVERVREFLAPATVRAAVESAEYRADAASDAAIDAGALAG